MKEITGTWNGKTALIESSGSETGFYIVNTVPYPFGQYRTRVYICDNNGIVLKWKPVFDYQSDKFNQLISQLEKKHKVTDKPIVKSKLSKKEGDTK